MPFCYKLLITDYFALKTLSLLAQIRNNTDIYAYVHMFNCEYAQLFSLNFTW